MRSLSGGTNEDDAQAHHTNAHHHRRGRLTENGYEGAGYSIAIGWVTALNEASDPRGQRHRHTFVLGRPVQSTNTYTRGSRHTTNKRNNTELKQQQHKRQRLQRVETPRLSTAERAAHWSCEKQHPRRTISSTATQQPIRSLGSGSRISQQKW